MNGATEPETEADECGQIREELLRVLEKARGRLAIAIAGESKSTTAVRRKQYLDTADYMRRYIRALRESKGHVPETREGWVPALEALQRIPNGEGAQSLCHFLKNIVAGLDRKKS